MGALSIALPDGRFSPRTRQPGSAGFWCGRDSYPAGSEDGARHSGGMGENGLELAYDDEPLRLPGAGAFETIDAALIGTADALDRVRALATQLRDEECDLLTGRAHEVRNALNAVIIAIDESGAGDRAS